MYYPLLIGNLSISVYILLDLTCLWSVIYGSCLLPLASPLLSSILLSRSSLNLLRMSVRLRLKSGVAHIHTEEAVLGST